jgi:DNA-binding transcriptional regulator YiaG
MNPDTLGQHLRSRRLLLKLTQEQAAHRLNTLRESYERWERDEVAPIASYWPRLIGFLGFYPGSIKTPGDLVLMARRLLGLSQFAFGRHLRTDAENVRKWEHGVSEPQAEMLKRIQQLVASEPLAARLTVNAQSGSVTLNMLLCQQLKLAH